MSLQRHAITLLAAVLLSSIAPSLYAQSRIAVVDLQRAMNETEDGRRAKARLKRLFRRRQKSLDAAQEKLKKMKEDIERQKNVLSREALEARLEEYQKAFIELQSTYVEYQRELAAKEAQLTKSILERMQEILRRIGQREGYTLIVEANEGGVVWVPGNLDLTDQVIQQYNQERGGSSSMSSMRSKRR
ncbi:MAG TPA: OmpH family outer membrane protein [Polyangiaceae bacterium LLY-WYZ-15_(1-7)]|nr:OmpH family outer membrane protein [Polyangiaceae bacterium LLY-WYZ-15_(1-7)]HJL04618.1 OmpH family outer membrane protein [Polyangiaceae bacterium LLY-WYZ-15_(1-7)]HJL07400.1 OmpH family outer membrane protein [Polyangiaceae bacterium LLY-WYZ-15_(1-7)]HJL26089.1 OmpH family outer membrane protein [Polyangiaceae bacterium LLY-WYZ-15_(1-7)]HJL38145.1 OmpH family outer membrane protein [Polyangiaceae bacterium LLY-WYZ-15_(1-7)]